MVTALDTTVDAHNRSEFLDWFEKHVVHNPTDTTLWHVSQEPEMALWRTLCSHVWKDTPTRRPFTTNTRHRIYRDMKTWLLQAIKDNYIVE